MDNLRTKFFLAIPFLVLGYMLSSAPFMMTSVAPTKPWADGPLKLVATPQFQTKKVPASTKLTYLFDGR
jgi:hypothetical protein